MTYAFAPRAIVAMTLVSSLVVVSVTSSASAAEVDYVSKKPSISVSQKTVAPREAVRFSGRTTFRTRVVVLQKAAGGKWRYVKRVKSSRGTYVIRTAKIDRGTNRFRVVVKQRKVNRHLVLKRRASKIVKVTGKLGREESPVKVVELSDDDVAKVLFLTRTYINNERLALGITSKMAHNQCLSDFAMGHSLAMATHDQFEHSDHPFFLALGNTPFQDACEGEANPRGGEVAALVHASDAATAARSAVTGWMNSPVHRAIITDSLGSDYQIGIGVAKTSDGYGWITGVMALNW